MDCQASGSAERRIDPIEPAARRFFRVCVVFRAGLLPIPVWKKRGRDSQPFSGLDNPMNQCYSFFNQLIKLLTSSPILPLSAIVVT